VVRFMTGLRAGGRPIGCASVAPVRVTPSWLTLREPADAAARSTELVVAARSRMAASRRPVVHDLGCGTGSMGRWLAPQLSGPQHWVLHDRDADLLEVAAHETPALSADGAPVTVETRQGDITRLDPAALAGASLVTASALLDMMTPDELERFVATCAAARCPVLVTLSVVGRVDLAPSDPLDERIAAAFNAHQRRTTQGRTLLGPDAVGAAAAALIRLGLDVQLRDSAWRLGRADSELAREWLLGWVGAALEQEPDLIAATADYLPRRLEHAAAGRLAVTVHHADLLAVPR